MKNTIVTIILTILTGFIFAENPTLNVQGVLRDVEGAAVPDGENYQLTFYLYDAVEGGSSIWSEDHIGVSVANGVYSAELGGTASLGGLPFSVPYYLGIAVNGGQESTPRIPLSMSPYALSVRGTTNTFPNDGNVIIGGTDGDHKLEIQNGNIEIQNDNADAQIRFHDPNDRFICMGIDQSDSHKFKIGNGAELGDNDFLIINDDNGDTWIKGKLQVHSSEDADLTNGALEIGNEGAQSIAIDGNEIVARNNGEPSTLYLNHSSGNTDVGSNLNVDGDITVNNIAPIMIRRYSLGSHYDIGHNTGVSTTDYSAAIIGADFGWLDYDEDGGGYGWRLLMDKRSDGTWQINGAMHAHQDPPDWTVDVMFIRKELVDDNR